MKKKIIWYILSLIFIPFIIFLTANIITVYSLNSDKKTNADFNDDLFAGMKTKTPTKYLKFSIYSPEELYYIYKFKRLFPNFEFDIPIEIVDDYYKVIGPTILDILETKNRSCHNQAHNVGRAIYNDLGDLSESMTICQDRCKFGCFHGMLLGVFGSFQNEESEPHTHEGDINSLHHITLDEIQDKVLNICYDYFSESHLCYHGVGHIFTNLAGYNVTKSLESCKLFEEEGEGVVFICATGAYMERSIYYGQEDLKVNFSYPCKGNIYPSACYSFKFRHLDISVELAAEKCIKLENNQRLACFFGLGAEFSKPHTNPNVGLKGKFDLGGVCSYGNLQDRQACIRGALWKKPRQAIQKHCKRLPLDLKNFCRNLARNTEDSLSVIE